MRTVTEEMNEPDRSHRRGVGRKGSSRIPSNGARNQVLHIDIQLDTGANCVTVRRGPLQRSAPAPGQWREIALHTSPRECRGILPFSGAVKSYLKAYIEVARSSKPNGSSTMPLPFTADVRCLMAAGRDRLQRMVQHAERHGPLLQENLNCVPEMPRTLLAHNVRNGHHYGRHPPPSSRSLHRQPRASAAPGGRLLEPSRSTA